MKKLIVRAVLGLVALLVLALIVVFFSLNSLVKQGVETVGPQLTKVDVRLGSVSLSPFSGSGRLSGLFVGNPEGFKTESAIQVGAMKVTVELGSLLGDTVVVNEIHIHAPAITFEGGLTGNNLSKIMSNLEAASGGDKGAAPESTSQRKFLVKDLVIRDGQILVSLTGLGGKLATVPLPDIHLTNIGTGGSGVSAAELTKQVMKELLASVTKAAAGAVTDLSKGVTDLGKEGAGQLEKAAKGVTDLFKKKK
jgi:hypothetical protein